MQDLIERLEKATGPDRELDYDLRIIDQPHTVGSLGLKSLPYTASIDAALTLTPELVFIEIKTGTQTGRHRFEWPIVVCGNQKTGKRIWRGQAATLPITLCIAALKARHAAVILELRNTTGEPIHG